MIMAFTGAGISKASGIDTFMERPDIRAKLTRSYAIKNPEDYREVIAELKRVVDKAQPNDAHLALAEHNCSIITMNIDSLHEKAGSQPLCLHGTLPEMHELGHCDTLRNKPVLYEDPAPNYARAIELVSQLTDDDTFIIIGASNHTAISYQLKLLAASSGAQIIDIQADAEHRVRTTLEGITSL